MINEKMLKLLILEYLIDKINTREITTDPDYFDEGKLRSDANKLLSEFLEPYLINSTSKES